MARWFAMRTLFFLCSALIALASPAFAQFPPPGVYTCDDAKGAELGTISLLVAGDYQWQTLDGGAVSGQMTSASTSVEALSGPLADQHWKGDFSTDGGNTTFVFGTDGGKVICQ